MVTGGLSTLETDELHAYEEGINADSAMLYLNWGDPLTIERLLETVKAFDEKIIPPNPQGHLLWSSNWFGGNKVYREPNWQWQKPYSFPALHPAFLNATPYAAVIVELEEGVRILSNVVDCAPGELEIGMPVQVGFERQADSVTLPVFRRC